MHSLSIQWDSFSKTGKIRLTCQVLFVNSELSVTAKYICQACKFCLIKICICGYAQIITTTTSIENMCL